MPKLSDLPDNEILVAADEPNTLYPVAAVREGIRNGNPFFDRTWYTADDNLEPDQQVEIGEEE